MVDINNFGESIRAIDMAIRKWVAKINWESVEGVARAFISEISKYDWEALIDGRWQRHLVTQVRDEALKRSDLTDTERADINDDFRAFEADFAKIIASDKTCDKQAVLNVVARALFIGMEAGLSPEKLRALREADRRESTKAATEARKADKIQAVINRHTFDLWKDKPSYKGNASGTAKEIQPKFNGEIFSWEPDGIPTGWEPVDCLVDPDKNLEAEKNRIKEQTEKQIDRLRKRIPKL